MKVKAFSAAALAALSVAALAPAASANSDSDSTTIPSGKLTAYVYIDNWSGWDNCGKFNTNTRTSYRVAKLTHSVEWDPIGIGASATIKGVGISISGNGGGSPTASFSNLNATYAGMSGTACASWSTIYLGVFSTGSTKLNGTYYTSTAHV